MWATSGTVFYAHVINQASTDAKLLANLREACHIILYNLADSIGVNGLSPTAHVVETTPYWEAAAYAVIAVLAVIDLAAVVVLVRGSLGKKKEA